jgi:hypothetical protein
MSGAVPQGVGAQSRVHQTSGSWMLPTSAGSDLLYVSSSSTRSEAGDVHVFSYPSGNVVGTLTGLQNPAALCADKSGNVFVPDTGAADIVEYAHGGTSPIQTLQDSGEPSACSVDPTSGNLAASNYNSFISVYKKATGTPTNYSAPFSTVFTTYDNKGNLFVSGPDRSAAQMVAELPNGGNSFETIMLDKRVGSFYPAGLQWFGKHLVIAHYGPEYYGCCGRIYRFGIKGTVGRHAGSFPTRKDIADFFVYGPVVGTTSGSYVYFYKYFQDHHVETQSIEVPGGNSYGIVISVAPSQARDRK